MLPALAHRAGSATFGASARGSSTILERGALSGLQRKSGLTECPPRGATRGKNWAGPSFSASSGQSSDNDPFHLQAAGGPVENQSA